MLLHYALKLRTIDFENVGVEKREAETLGMGIAVRTDCRKRTQRTPSGKIFALFAVSCGQWIGLIVADPKGLAPSAFPQTTGCSSD